MKEKLEPWLLAAWSLVLFGICYGLHTQHIGFPFHRHPDEPGKVEQILRSEWNFHHPMLLLSTTKLAVRLTDARSEQEIVEAGRKVSAAFTAIAVVALSLLAYMWRGWIGTLLAGGALTLHHQLYELSHYMKEDAALLMGVALTFLTASWYCQRRHPARAAALGIACALAGSGKYLGLIMLLVAVIALWPRKEKPEWLTLVFSIIAFLCAALVTLFIVNLPLFTQIAAFQSSFGREMDFVVHGQRGMTRSVPHAQYWNVFVDNTTPAIWVLMLAFMVARWRDWKSLRAVDLALILFPFAYALALSFSPKSNDRYFLPATAIFTTMAVLGVGDAARMLASWPRSVVIGAAAALLLTLQVTGSWPNRPGFLGYARAFQHDDPAELFAWIQEHLPKDAVIARDNRTGLLDPTRKKHATRGPMLEQKVVGGRYANDLKDENGKSMIASLDDLRARGVTHVVVSESDYGRFLLNSLRPQKAEEENFLRRKAFYEALFREAKLLWERDRGTVIYLHPGIRVYAI